MATSRSTGAWAPDWTVAPGEILSEALEERGMSQAELARRMARPLKTINEIANGKAAITADTAIQLERALGISASFWNGIEARYREDLARRRAADQLESFSTWARRFPVAQMERLDLIGHVLGWADRAQQLLQYFRVGSPDGWDLHWGAVAASYRAPAAFVPDPYALAAWLRWGELEAEPLRPSAFSEKALREALPSIRELTLRQAFPVAYRRLQQLLEEAGVAFVAIDVLGDSRVSGATRWPGAGHALVQVSFRHGSDDQFWYTVFHELGHVLYGPRRGLVVDQLAGDTAPDLEAADEELAADTFARETLLPEEPYAAFVGSGVFTRQSISAFAASQGVSAGIVVGRLERDDHVDRGRFTSLRRTYDRPGR